jgi:hypothetical protein
MRYLWLDFLGRQAIRLAWHTNPSVSRFNTRRDFMFSICAADQLASRVVTDDGSRGFQATVIVAEDDASRSDA